MPLELATEFEPFERGRGRVEWRRARIRSATPIVPALSSGVANGCQITRFYHPRPCKRYYLLLIRRSNVWEALLLDQPGHPGIVPRCFDQQVEKIPHRTTGIHLPARLETDPHLTLRALHQGVIAAR